MHLLPPFASAHFHRLIPLWSINLSFYATRLMSVSSCYKPPGSLFKSTKGIRQKHIISTWTPTSVVGAWHIPHQVCASEALSWGCIWRFRLIEATQKSHRASHRQTPAALEGHRRRSWHPEHHFAQPSLQGSFGGKLVYYNTRSCTEHKDYGLDIGF